MIKELISEGDNQDDSNFMLNTQFITNSLDNIKQLESKIKNFECFTSDEHFYAKFKQMMQAADEMMLTINKNSVFLNNKTFSVDFFKSITKINTAFIAYLQSLNNIDSQKIEKAYVAKIQSDIYEFSLCLIIFSSNFQEIIKQVINLQNSSESQNDELNNLKTRLGIESSLFNFSVDVHPIEEFPYYQSKYVKVYQYYDVITNITSRIHAIKSFCGTGKTICIPLILFCRNLREKNISPFILMTQPLPTYVENKKKKFSDLISKYVTITTDPNKLIEIYTNFSEGQNLTFGLLTPHNLLPLTESLKSNPHFFKRTRFIIDEINQRSFHLSILISRISYLNHVKKVFELPLNVVLTSASFSSSILSPFKNEISFEPDVKSTTTLVKNAQYKIFEEPPILLNSAKSVKHEIIDKSKDILKQMSFINSDIEEGHVICFIPETFACNKLKNSLYTIFKHHEETDINRKIVILKSSLKPNEQLDHFFDRLRLEYNNCEEIRKGKEYKYEILYFIPIVFTGLSEDSIFQLIQDEFPTDLKKVNKFIISSPIIESSFNIDNLSVVIDSGLVKEMKFDNKTALTNYFEKQASKESIFLRKGRLGRTMNGLYVSFQSSKKVFDYPNPPVKCADLTTNILLMKQINIDVDQMGNLPDDPNWYNFQFSIDTLKRIGAINDNGNLNITEFGQKILRFPFISIYYAAAMITYSNKFRGEEYNNAFFITGYISTIIMMSKLLIREGMTEKLSFFFSKSSDIVTLYRALNELLKNSKCCDTKVINSNKDSTNNSNSNNSNNNDDDDDDNNNRNIEKVGVGDANNNDDDDDSDRNLVESFGFRYNQFMVFKSHLQEIANVSFPGKNLSEIIDNISKKKIKPIIDDFINEIKQFYPYWQEVHTLYFRRVEGAGNFETTSHLIYEGVGHKKKDHGIVSVSKRPGWNGITAPCSCYCFNITQNYTGDNRYNGELIHRINPTQRAIQSIEIDKTAFNPWFNVLIEAYFEKSDLNVTKFKDDVRIERENSNPHFLYHNRNFYNNNTINNDNNNVKYHLFNYSNVGERVFLSFIANEKDVINQIKKGVNECLKLLPYTPRSVLVYRRSVDLVIEINSYGSDNYISFDSSSYHACRLDREMIDYCISRINELKKTISRIRICSLFINETCKLDEYDQENLYLIREQTSKTQKSILEMPKVLDLVLERSKQLKKVNIKRSSSYSNVKEEDEIGFFQFPSNLVHPSLVSHEESRECIMKWFKDYCPQVKVKRIVDYKFMMKLSDIRELQQKIQNNFELIKKQLNLSYVAFPIPTEIYEKEHLAIAEHQTWIYKIRFKVIIATLEESKEVQKFIKEMKSKYIKNGTIDANKLAFKPNWCTNDCDDPDNPVLTSLPISIFFENGKAITNKICRNCIFNELRYSTQGFYTNKKINIDALENIILRPKPIRSIPSKEIKNGMEKWPQVPLGLLVSILINNKNDGELSSIVSDWLFGITEFTIRVTMKNFITFCPDHPSTLFKINKDNVNSIRCNNEDCNNAYCQFCGNWHPDDRPCEARKNKRYMHQDDVHKCVKCNTEYIKDKGCNFINCPNCNTSFCYICNYIFKSDVDGYYHLSTVHKSIFRDNSNNNNNNDDDSSFDVDDGDAIQY